MFGPKPVHKVHGRDEPGFGGRSADVREIGVGLGGVQGTNDAAVQGDFGGEIGEMEVAWRS